MFIITPIKENIWLWTMGAVVVLPCLYLVFFSTYSDVPPAVRTPVAVTTAQPAPLSIEEQNRIGDEAIRNSVMSRIKVTDDLLAGAEIDLKRGNMNNLDMYAVGAMLEVISSSARGLQSAWRSHDKLTKADIAQLRSIEARLSSFQQRALPKLRQSFKQVASQMLWEQDIEVGLVGNSTIVFVGALFAANANIKQVQEQVHELLTKLRFKHARYQWYRGSRGSVYTLGTPADAVVAVYDNGFSKLERGKAGTSK